MKNLKYYLFWFGIIFLIGGIILGTEYLLSLNAWMIPVSLLLISGGVLLVLISKGIRTKGKKKSYYGYDGTIISSISPLRINRVLTHDEAKKYMGNQIN